MLRERIDQPLAGGRVTAPAVEPEADLGALLLNPPAGYPHGEVGSHVQWLLGNFVRDRNGVLEYWLIDAAKEEVTVFPAMGGRFDGGIVYASGHAWPRRSCEDSRSKYAN